MSYTTSATKPVSVSRGRCSCGCAEPSACTCCDLVCFERPEYHCGHLLTDADLALQVRYVLEKNKLRNRALHGHGVVCGLKLTCEPDCKGTIAVHQGYAIDDCGNDIVVCEKTCFDVIAALEACHLIVKARDADPCKPEDRYKEAQHECKYRQCFYITICYEEQEADYETPFQTGCASGPQDCVPTRVKERFRVEVTDKLPHARNQIEQIELKIQRCFKLFLDSAVGRLIQSQVGTLEAIAAGGAQRSADKNDPNCELFCALKAHFQQYLKTWPDELTCNLAHEVACLTCPEAAGDSYGSAMQKAFERLFELMHVAQYDCVLSSLVFGCAEPCEASCVLLGCVEVEGGKLLRVCNTPRQYVWSFANLIPLLMEIMLTGALTAAPSAVARGPNDPEGGEPQGPHQCCPEYKNFSAKFFLHEFRVAPEGRYLAATAPLRAIRGVHSALGSSFDFTNSESMATALFRNVKPEQLPRLAESLGLRVTTVTDPGVGLRPLDPMQAFLAESLLRPLDPVRTYSQRDTPSILPDYANIVSPERSSEAQRAATAPTDLQTLLAERDHTIDDLKGQLEALAARVTTLERPPQ